jgi:hypothetical protein
MASDKIAVKGRTYRFKCKETKLTLNYWSYNNLHPKNEEQMKYI